MKEELAIMKGVHVGMRDCSQPVFWFEVELLHGGALQVLSIEEMVHCIMDANVYKLDDLEGKPCIVVVDGPKVTFKEMKK